MNNFVKNTLILIWRAFISIFASVFLFIYATFLSVIYFVLWLILKICLLLTSRIKPHIIRLYSTVFNIPINKFVRRNIYKITEPDIEQIVQYLYENESFIIEDVIKHFGWSKRQAEKVRNLLEEMEVVFKNKENKNTTTFDADNGREFVKETMLENIENFN